VSDGVKTIDQKRALGLVPEHWSIVWSSGKSVTGNPTGQRHVVIKVTHVPSGRTKEVVLTRLSKRETYVVIDRHVAQLIASLDPSWRSPVQRGAQPATVPKKKRR